LLSLSLDLIEALFKPLASLPQACRFRPFFVRQSPVAALGFQLHKLLFDLAELRHDDRSVNEVLKPSAHDPLASVVVD
jgi:hypothetical protein